MAPSESRPSDAEGAAAREARAADPTLASQAAADRVVRKAFFDERRRPAHDQTYLLVTL